MSDARGFENTTTWRERLLRGVTPILAICLGIASSFAMVIAVVLAFDVAPELQKKLGPSAIEALWKIAVAFGCSAGLLLGWLVKHLHALDLVRANSNAKLFVDFVASANAFEKTILGKLLQEQIDNRLTFKKVLLEAEFEPMKQQILHEAALIAREKNDEYDEKKAKRAQQIIANKAFRDEVERAHGCFQKLCTPGAAQTRDDLATLIDESLEARSRVKTARNQVDDAYGLDAKDYRTTLDKYDAAIIDIIVEVQRAPRMSPLMPMYERRLDARSEFLKLLTHYLDDQKKFREVFAVPKKGLQNRLVKLIVSSKVVQTPPSNKASR